MRFGSKIEENEVESDLSIFFLRLFFRLNGEEIRFRFDGNLGFFKRCANSTSSNDIDCSDDKLVFVLLIINEFDLNSSSF